jgi:hypothetical protein
MKLTHLKDKTLLNDTKMLAGIDRETTLKLLHHLKEIDRRKLYSDLKFSSLFNYCVHELGYSEGSAQRRIVAARMMRDIPEIEEKIEKGKLTLSNISLVNQFIEKPSDRRKVLKAVEGLTKRQCERRLFEITGRELVPEESKKRLSHDKIQVAVVLSDETLAEIEKLKALMGRDISMDELVRFMAKEAIKSVEKNKFKQTQKPKSLSPVAVGRRIPANMKRDVYKRDQKCVNCGSQHRLNYDHRVPYALSGLTNKENLRLLCFQCNQRARIRAGLQNSPHPSGLL